MSALLTRAWKVLVQPGTTSASLDTSTGTSVTSKDQWSTEELRVVFHITKTLEKQPNTMMVKVYNLSDASRSKFSKQGMAVSLEAGYKNVGLGTNTRAVIFSGNSRLVPDHQHEGPEWETTIYCGDGESLLNASRFVKAYAGSQDAGAVIRDVAKALGVNTGNLNDALNAGGLPFKKFEHGVSFNGSASDVFDSLMRTAGYTWSVQQGALMVLQPGKGATEEVVVLSKDTGLIGSPEHTPPHHTKKPSFLTAKCLLNPKIRPGHLVRMNALNVKGDFIVQKVIHQGDSHGAEWTTHFEALASSQPVTTVQ